MFYSFLNVLLIAQGSGQVWPVHRLTLRVREDAGGLSREYVLRIPSVSEKATKGRRYIAIVADTCTAQNNNLT